MIFSRTAVSRTHGTGSSGRSCSRASNSTMTRSSITSLRKPWLSSAAIETVDRIVFEAHSTDYQTPQALAALVRDHFAILKVGPGLTFALREALWALDAIERETTQPTGAPTSGTSRSSECMLSQRIGRNIITAAATRSICSCNTASATAFAITGLKSSSLTHRTRLFANLREFRRRSLWSASIFRSPSPPCVAASRPIPRTW